MKALLFAAVFLALLPAALAQRQLEKLGRGVIVMRTGTTSAYVGWRLLGTDPVDTKFNLYRVTSGVTNLAAASLTNSCNYADTADLTLANSWFVQPVLNGATQTVSAAFTLPANSPTQQYLNLPLTPPPGGTTWDGVPFTETANDGSVGDVDGDGEYEIFLKWDPTNSKDNSFSGFTGNTFLDCYKLDGTRLWRIDLGPNIRSGAHYMDFMVYDFDGDGKAELMCRTAPGARDGQTNYVGGAAKWQNANGTRPTFNNTNDYRFNHPGGVTNGYVLAGPEFITVFNGLTGEELATATWSPHRDPDTGNDNPSTSTMNSIWGDNYGNRIDRFLAGIAFCDGIRPSAIFCRGYYTRAYLTAWDWRTNTLTKRWAFASDPSNLSYKGQGAHSLSIGDVDGDGKDDIIYGAACIRSDGTGLYSTALGHGDAEHFSDMDPLRPGKEVWFVHESPSSYGPNGLEMHDAATGQVLVSVDGQNSDVGRGVAYDIDPRYRGYEMWGSRGGLMSATGVQISSSHPSQQNFCVWWDADTLRETLDGTTVYKWNWTNAANNSILSPAGLSSNNSTKSTPCLSGDLFGDWREEIIWRTSDNLNLRIYTTTTPATNRLYTLMHDPQYRCAIAWQNTGYNQPPHPGFYIGSDMFPPPLAPISSADLVWRGNASSTWDAASANWFTNGLWVSNNTAVAFAADKSVLFDLSGSNNSPVTIAGTLAPAQVTVHSAKDFTFTGVGQLSGAMQLVKAGEGKLTLNNTNTHTGATVVSGGKLFVSGALTASPVTVERRGTPEGASQFGGAGQLGAGLTIQSGCRFIVGPGTNATGTLTVTNGVTLLGTSNQFDLSNNPGGATNDRVVIIGNLTLAGTNLIEITQLNGALGAGVYPLFTYSGTLTGGLGNLALVGTFLQSVALTNPPGVIGLVATVPAAPPNPPTNLVAVALNSVQINLTWTDAATNENNFLIERSTDNTNFTQLDTIAANSIAYSDFGLAPSTTYFYRVRSANLAGVSTNSNIASATTTSTPVALTWRGDGTVNAWDITTTSNWLNGASTTVYADTAVITFNDVGSNSPTIALTGTLLPTAVTVNATKTYTFGGSGSLNGAMTLNKSGSSSLTINNTNNFTGGVKLTNGTLITGSIGANTRGLGSGSITFYGGTLEFVGWTGASGTEYGGNTNALIVPSGQSGTIHLPQRFQSPGFTGALTGGGTLNLQVKYLRGDVLGNWSAFTGALNITRGNTGVTVDDFRVGNAAGWPLARLAVGTNVLMYSRATAGSIIPVGQFSAVPGAVVTAGGCSGNCGAGTQNSVTWRVGGLNTDTTNAALFSGTTSLIKEGSGKWTLTGDNTYSGTTAVNGGALIVNGNQSAATGDVTVNGGGVLGGAGSLGGVTTVNGILSPGDNSIAPLTFAGNLTLGAASTTLIGISRNPIASDLVAVAGTLTLNGTLNVVNVSPEILAAGDAFQLFSTSAFTGSFTNVSLPALDAGLAWNTATLNSSGVISVVAITTPILGQLALDGNNLLLNGSNGVPGASFYLLGSSNLNQPLATWSVLQTNQFDAGGNFSFTNALNLNWPQGYYRLLVP